MRDGRAGRGRVALLAGVLALAMACGTEPAPEERTEDATAGEAGDPLLVLAASDLMAAFEELVPRFEERTGREVNVVLGSTGNLAAQIRHGAPADVFFAADEAFVDDLVERGRIDPATRRLYAVGRVVLVAPPDREPPGTVAALADPAYRSVAIANPEHAPYGRAARQALENAGVWEAVEPRAVLGENIAHTLQFVETRNVDAAVVALSLVESPSGSRLPFTLVDDALHAPLRQAAGVVADSRHPDAARRLLDFVLSREGQAILESYGFEAPPGAAAAHR